MIGKRLRQRKLRLDLVLGLTEAMMKLITSWRKTFIWVLFT